MVSQKSSLLRGLLLIVILVIPMSCQQDESSDISPSPETKPAFTVATYEEVEQSVGDLFDAFANQQDELRVEDKSVPAFDLGRLDTDLRFKSGYLLMDSEYQRPLSDSKIAARDRRFDLDEELTKLKFSKQFKNLVIELYNYSQNWDNKSYASVAEWLLNKRKAVAKSKMVEVERFALTQLYGYSLAVIARAFSLEHKLGPGDGMGYRTATDCPDLDNKNAWRNIGRNAIAGGLAGGIRYGGQGAIAGAAATLNPIVGGIVGGGIGFTLGFLGGALLSGGTTLIATCLMPDPAPHVPIKAFCDSKGKVVYAKTVSVPVGFHNCGAMSELETAALMPEHGKPKIRDFFMIKVEKVHKWLANPN